MPPERVFIGLGANLGQSHAALLKAADQISLLPGTRVVEISPVYTSAPVDATGPDYINAVVEVETALAPADLMQALLGIEAEQGRLRAHRHAPRTLDLDLLLYGQRISDDPFVTLPHPRLHLRAFVLLPLLDIEPRLVHPVLGPLMAHRSAVAGQCLRKLG